MRITGLATGLDIDSIVKASLTGYQTKIDTVKQNKEVLEIKQTLYRDLMSQANTFYNKYFNLSGSNSLLLSKDYSSVSFTSTDASVATAKGASGAPTGTYTIDVKSVAKGSSAQISKDQLVAGNTVEINGKEYVLEGTSSKTIAQNLNSALSAEGITATYSDFSNALEIETSADKKDLEVKLSEPASKSDLTVTKGNTATKASTSIEAGNVTAGKTLEINGKTITLTGSDATEITKNLNSELKSLGLAATYSSSAGLKIKADADGAGTISGAKFDGADLTVTDGTDAVKSSAAINSSDVVEGNKILVNGRAYTLTGNNTDEMIKNLNTGLSKLGSGVSAVNDNGNIKLEYKTAGAASFTASVVSKGTQNAQDIAVTAGTDAEVVITDSKGNPYTHTGTKNTVTLDDTTFTFTAVGKTTLTGTTDVEDLKDKIVNFVNDYNELITSLNTQIQTKHSRDYVPLTSDQKSAMSDKEIELWEAKVKEGQLYRDSDLTRITESLKSTMRTYSSSLNINLEKMGITPVQDYSGTKNGTFTIDEDKLTTALSERSEDVVKFLTGDPSTNSKGILYDLKDTLESEFVKSSSSLAKKAGLEGTTTFTSNTITKQISEMETKLSDMETLLSTKEQTLYSKWATVETLMNKLNSQQSSLSSYFS